MANTPISTTQYGKYINLQSLSGSDPGIEEELGSIFLTGTIGSERVRTHAGVTFPNLTFTSGSSATVTTVLDEDGLGSNSATALATQQSIKAYVDAQVTAQDLDVSSDSGTIDIDLDSETFTIAGTANEVETSAAGTTVTVGLPSNVTITTNLTATGGTAAFGTTTTSTIVASGIVKTDDTTEATSTTDGSLQTDGGLSVAKSAVIGDDLDLLSDSAIFSMGAGKDATFTHDGTTGLTIAATPVTVQSTGKLTFDASENIVLDSDATGSVVFKDGGAEFGRIYTDTGNKSLILSSSVSDADISFKGNDGGTQITALKLDMSDAGNATFNGTLTCATSLTIGSAAMSEADLEKLDGITNGTAAAAKAVVLDASKNIATLGTVGCGAITSTGASTMGSLNVGGTLACDTSFTIDAVALNATELGYLDSTTAGTSVASKAMVTDANGDILMPDSDKFELGASSDMQLYHDGTNSYIANKTGALKIATETSGIAVTIGHGTSEVTVADNLTVSGNLTVTGTTITDTVEVISTSSGVLFEGGTNDGHEATMLSAVAGADVTYTLPNLTGHIPLLAGAASNANVTAAEFALLDGGSSVGTTAVADGDGIVTNDNGTMKHTTVQTFQTYFDANSVGGTSMVTVGALNAGSITSGFGAIDNGTSNITTGGVLKVDVDGSAINGAGSLTFGAGNDAAVYFNGTDLVLDAPSGAGHSIRVAGTEVAIWEASGLSLAAGDAYSIDDTSVLNATTLGSAVVASSLTSVGALNSGTITSGFGNIDNGSSTLDCGALTAAAADVTSLTCEGNVTVGDDGTGADATFRAVTSSQYMFWDASGNSNKGALGFGKTPAAGYIIDCKASDGDIRADAFVTYSDERLKTNINAIANPMDKLQKLCGVSYDMKADGRQDIGFIAQDVQKVVPEVVRDSGDTMGIDYSRLTALLVEAVKSQQVEISTLKDAISQLKK